MTVGEQPDQQDQPILRNLEEPDRGDGLRGREIVRVGKIGLPEIDEFERGQFRRPARIRVDPVERCGLQAVRIAGLAKAQARGVPILRQRRVGDAHEPAGRGGVVAEIQVERGVGGEDRTADHLVGRVKPRRQHHRAADDEA